MKVRLGVMIVIGDGADYSNPIGIESSHDLD